MSGYIYNEVIRIPLPNDIKDKLGDDYSDDFEELIGDLHYDVLRNPRRKGFTLYYDGYSTPSRWFLDYQYNDYYEFNEDFGNVSLLTDNEYELVKQYFRQVTNEIPEQEVFRKVEYCYWNGGDSECYYEIYKHELTEKDLWNK